MRPHRLQLHALGPYAGEVDIDFDPLTADGLFLIHGPTGAGKTFLLDALCFALYGEVPGARNRDTLRSDHAEPDAHPWIELEFSSQGARYRVHRVPMHERRSRRGAGTTQQASKATLARLEGGAWMPVAEKVTDVNQAVTHLLGLTAVQFQQVILLPQGRFEQVLRADNATREQLLQKLFDTELYARAAAWLDHEAKRRRLDVAAGERELATLRRQAADRWHALVAEGAVDGDEEAVGGVADEARGIEPGDGTPVDDDGALDGAGHDGPAWPADQHELDAVADRLEALAVAAATEAADAAAELAAADAAFNAARTRVDAWDRHRRLLDRQAELDAAASTIDGDRRRLDDAGDAEALRPALDDVEHHTTAADDAADALDRATRTVARRAHACPVLPDDIALPAPGDEVPSLRRLDAIAPLLSASRAELRELARDAERAAELDADAAEASAERRSAERAVHRHTTVAAEHHARAADLDAQAAEALAAAGQLDTLRRDADRAAERAEAAEALERVERRLAAATATCTAADDRFRACWDEALTLRQRHLDGIAATLARTLVDGDACPVCGAAKHPAPAQEADDSVTAAEVDDAQDRADEARAAAERARAVHTDLLAEAAGLRGRAGDDADDPPAALAAAAAATDAVRLAERIATTADELAGDADRARRLAAEAEEAVRNATAIAVVAQDRAEQAAKQAQGLRDDIADAIGAVDPVAAVAALDALLAAVAALVEAARRHHTACELRDASVTALRRQIADTAFAGVEDVAAALIDERTRTALVERIAAHDRAVVEVRHDLADAALADLPAERPDVDGPEAAVAVARQAGRAAAARQVRLDDARQAVGGWAAAHRSAAEATAAARAEAELWGTVAERTNGRLAPKVSLQRWVLSAYLEEICGHANGRLAAMTDGRYRLSVHRDGERHAGKAGLGLRVHDAHTGLEREVATLSGGETFQASLALALGVADAVAAHTGGVRLEALFVDEGFGTLDAEALQLAMDELDRLRDGGRTVGLISHVGALRERVRTGISVTPTERGSRVHVGPITPL